MEVRNILAIENKKFDDTAKLCVQHISSGINVFITGGGGTGKTRMMKQIVSKLLDSERDIKIAIVALTAQAANVASLDKLTALTFDMAFGIGGISIHDIATNPVMMNNTIAKKAASLQWIKQCNLLVMDEISLFTHLHLDFVDAMFKTIKEDARFMGGAQLLICGDFLQAPPSFDKALFGRYNDRGENIDDVIQSMYAFNSKIWTNAAFENVVLEFNWRANSMGASDATKRWSALLDRLREGKLTITNSVVKFSEITDIYSVGDINLIESRKMAEIPDDAVVLFKDWKPVNAHNNEMQLKLQKVGVEIHIYNREVSSVSELTSETVFGKQIIDNTGIATINLCVGSRVIVKRNIRHDTVKLNNGTIGKVVKFAPVREKFAYGVATLPPNLRTLATEKVNLWYNAVKKLPVIDANGDECTIYPMVYVLSSTEVVVQIPLYHAWALTITGIQGETYDKICPRITSTTDPGTAYTAFSRATSIEGLYLTNDVINYSSFVPYAAPLIFYNSLKRGLSNFTVKIRNLQTMRIANTDAKIEGHKLIVPVKCEKEYISHTTKLPRYMVYGTKHDTLSNRIDYSQTYGGTTKIYTGHRHFSVMNAALLANLTKFLGVMEFNQTSDVSEELQEEQTRLVLDMFDKSNIDELFGMTSLKREKFLKRMFNIPITNLALARIEYVYSSSSPLLNSVMTYYARVGRKDLDELKIRVLSLESEIETMQHPERVQFLRRELELNRTPVEQYMETYELRGIYARVVAFMWFYNEYSPGTFNMDDIVPVLISRTTDKTDVYTAFLDLFCGAAYENLTLKQKTMFYRDNSDELWLEHYEAFDGWHINDLPRVVDSTYRNIASSKFRTGGACELLTPYAHMQQVNSLKYEKDTGDAYRIFLNAAIAFDDSNISRRLYFYLFLITMEIENDDIFVNAARKAKEMALNLVGNSIRGPCYLGYAGKLEHISDYYTRVQGWRANVALYDRFKKKPKQTRVVLTNINEILHVGLDRDEKDDEIAENYKNITRLYTLFNDMMSNPHRAIFRIAKRLPGEKRYPLTVEYFEKSRTNFDEGLKSTIPSEIVQHELYKQRVEYAIILLKNRELITYMLSKTSDNSVLQRDDIEARISVKSGKMQEILRIVYATFRTAVEHAEYIRSSGNFSNFCDDLTAELDYESHRPRLIHELNMRKYCEEYREQRTKFEQNVRINLVGPTYKYRMISDSADETVRRGKRRTLKATRAGEDNYVNAGIYARIECAQIIQFYRNRLIQEKREYDTKKEAIMAKREAMRETSEAKSKERPKAASIFGNEDDSSSDEETAEEMPDEEIIEEPNYVSNCAHALTVEILDEFFIYNRVETVDGIQRLVRVPSFVKNDVATRLSFYDEICSMIECALKNIIDKKDYLASLDNDAVDDDAKDVESEIELFKRLDGDNLKNIASIFNDYTNRMDRIYNELHLFYKNYINKEPFFVEPDPIENIQLLNTGEIVSVSADNDIIFEYFRDYVLSTLYNNRFEIFLNNLPVKAKTYFLVSMLLNYVQGKGIVKFATLFEMCFGEKAPNFNMPLKFETLSYDTIAAKLGLDKSLEKLIYKYENYDDSRTTLQARLSNIVNFLYIVYIYYADKVPILIAKELRSLLYENETFADYRKRTHKHPDHINVLNVAFQDSKIRAYILEEWEKYSSIKCYVHLPVWTKDDPACPRIETLKTNCDLIAIYRENILPNPPNITGINGLRIHLENVISLPEDFDTIVAEIIENFS